MEKIIMKAKKNETDTHERHGVVPLFIPDTGKKILDIGCGNGYLSHKLIKKSNIIIGLDLNSQNKDVLKEKNVHLIIHDLNSNSLPFKDESIDIVVSFHCLEHLYRPDKCLFEIRRILKKEGYAIVSVPNYASPDFCIKLLSGKGFHDSQINEDGTMEDWMFYYHHKYFTYYSIKRLLECTGFNVEKVITPIPSISTRYNRMNIIIKFLINSMSIILFRVSPRFCQEPIFIITKAK